MQPSQPQVHNNAKIPWYLSSAKMPLFNDDFFEKSMVIVSIP